jgi:hypothetical protein
MSEGNLFASKLPGAYAVGTPDGPDLVSGQALDLLLGGHWITGRVKYSGDVLDTDNSDSQRKGTYNHSRTDEYDTVAEASEESFPASDAPAWSSDDQADQSPESGKPAVGYYFVADEDQSICGLCVGMQIRGR